MSTSEKKPIPVTAEYVTRNIKGSWEKIEITAEEVGQIKSETNKTNVEVLRRLKEKYGKEFSENEILALFDKLSQHYRFQVERYVDQKLFQEKK